MKDASFLPLSTYREYPPEEMLERAKEFADDLQRRRTIRDFSDRSLPPGLIEYCLQAALSAPSGANMQPWHFAVVRDPEIKHRIRLAAELEEKEFYTHRASAEWLEALQPLGTDEHKPFLDAAVYRGGDLVSGWLYTGLAAIGLSIGAIALVAAPIAAFWAILALRLGVREKALAAEQEAAAVQ